MKAKVILSVAAAMTLGVAGAAYAFHSGGVAECEGCHTMHNSFENASVDPNRAQFVASPYLLRGVDQSSTCLKCPAQPDTAPTGYHILGIGYSNTGPNLYPVERTPGGDFAWLLKDHKWLD